MNLLVVLSMLVASAPAEVSTPPVDQSAEAEKIRFVFMGVVQQFRLQLKDAPSARFRSVFVQTTIGTDGHYHHALCGQVNARNGFGGYSGWESFFATAEHLTLERDSIGPMTPSVLCDQSKNLTPRTADFASYLQQYVSAP